MSNDWQKARDAVKMLDVAIKGMEQLQSLTKLGGDKAGAALMVIDAGLSSISSGFSGETSPEIVEADIKAAVENLMEGLATNNAEADTDLDKRFPT